MPLLHGPSLDGFGGYSGDAGLYCRHGSSQKRKFEFCSGGDTVEQINAGTEYQAIAPNAHLKRPCLRPSHSDQGHMVEERLPGCLKDDQPVPSLVSPLASLSSSSPLTENNVGVMHHFWSQSKLSGGNNNEGERERIYPLPQDLRLQRIPSSIQDTNMDFDGEDDGGFIKDDMFLDHDVGIGSNITTTITNNNNDDDFTTHDPTSQHYGTMDSSTRVFEVSDSCSLMDSDFVPDVAQYTPGPPTGTLVAQSLSQAQSISQEKRCGYVTCGGLKPSPVSGRLHCHCSASWRGMYGLDNGYITDFY